MSTPTTSSMTESQITPLPEEEETKYPPPVPKHLLKSNTDDKSKETKPKKRNSLILASSYMKRKFSVSWGNFKSIFATKNEKNNDNSDSSQSSQSKNQSKAQTTIISPRRRNTLHVLLGKWKSKKSTNSRARGGSTPTVITEEDNNDNTKQLKPVLEDLSSPSAIDTTIKDPLPTKFHPVFVKKFQKPDKKPQVNGSLLTTMPKKIPPKVPEHIKTSQI